MKLTVKLVSNCPRNRRGEFIIKSNSKAEIHISKLRNKTVGEFSETLLHELLHFWCTILQSHGLAKPQRKEHKFIYKAVDKIIHIYNQTFGR